MADAIDIAAEHAALVEALRAAGTPYHGGDQNDSYTGSGRPFFNVSAPERRRLARAWLQANKAAPTATILQMVDRCFDGVSHEEKTHGSILLGYSVKARAATSPAMVERWSSGLNGWAEVDCLTVFGAPEMSVDWPAWRALIEKLGVSANINQRRAALVLLTRPVRTSDDPRFAELALATVQRLKHEKPILITKAVSWLLRSLVERHRALVAAYLEANASSLPAIAVRETRTKLRSGTKSGRPSKMRVK